ncbi:MAG: thioredoxin-like negative regulator of GroEL [Crocinitomicaceae bacterium]
MDGGNLGYVVCAMWKNALSHSLGLICLIGVVSCDKLESVVSGVVGESLPTERRQGISQVHDASASDVKLWLAEPNVLVVLDFYSPTCGTCQALSPKLDAMAKKYAEHSAIMKVNVGKPGEAAMMAMNEYQIDKIPVLKFFLNGKEVEELKGDQSAESLESVFSKYTIKVEGEFTMKEGDLPGAKSQQTAEEMMVRVKKGDLAAGITRVRVPKDAQEVTEGLPKGLLEASPDVGQPSTPASEGK